MSAVQHCDTEDSLVQEVKDGGGQTVVCRPGLHTVLVTSLVVTPVCTFSENATRFRWLLFCGFTSCGRSLHFSSKRTWHSPVLVTVLQLRAVEIILVQNFSQKLTLLGTGNQPVDHSGLTLLLHADSFTNFLSHLIKAYLHFLATCRTKITSLHSRSELESSAPRLWWWW